MKKEPFLALNKEKKIEKFLRNLKKMNKHFLFELYIFSRKKIKSLFKFKNISFVIFIINQINLSSLVKDVEI